VLKPLEHAATSALIASGPGRHLDQLAVAGGWKGRRPAGSCCGCTLTIFFTAARRVGRAGVAPTPQSHRYVELVAGPAWCFSDCDIGS